MAVNMLLIITFAVRHSLTLLAFVDLLTLVSLVVHGQINVRRQWIW